MKKALLFKIIFILVFTLTVFAGAVYVDYFNVISKSDGSVYIEFKTNSEISVSSFIIQRSPDGNNWADVHSFQPIGTSSSGSTYSWIDNSFYKTSDVVFYYRLEIKFNDGTNTQYMGVSSISPKLSGVKKTWGSIKAMFR